MNKCNACDSEILTGDKFCMNCGSSIVNPLEDNYVDKETHLKLSNKLERLEELNQDYQKTIENYDRLMYRNQSEIEGLKKQILNFKKGLSGSGLELDYYTYYDIPRRKGNVPLSLMERRGRINLMDGLALIRDLNPSTKGFIITIDTSYVELGEWLDIVEFELMGHGMVIRTGKIHEIINRYMEIPEKYLGRMHSYDFQIHIQCGQFGELNSSKDLIIYEYY